MLRKIFGSVAILLIAAGAYVAYGLWASTKGLSPEALAAQYMTGDDRFVEIAGARVRVREEGPADAPALLLLHGFTHSLETWDGWAAALREDYRVIRYDLLGHGLTGPDPEKRYAPDERAAFIGDVLDALGRDQAIIAGNSLGGLAAWRFAAAVPERVSGLILVSPGAFSINGVGDEPVEVPAAMKAFLLTAPEAGVRASAQYVYGDDAKITEKRITLMRDMMRRRGNGEAMIASLEEFTLPDPAPLLAKITAPTLILWGEEDILVPTAQAALVADAIPGAKLITYPGVGHAAQEEAPEETAADAAAFLAGIAGGIGGRAAE